ncbi:MAG: hypothetical protein KDA70_08190 [Planctomycetaceae bacterium]|nr:hypothetical protein [Planctomycetaceae bacterium]
MWQGLLNEAIAWLGREMGKAISTDMSPEKIFGSDLETECEKNATAGIERAGKATSGCLGV